VGATALLTSVRALKPVHRDTNLALRRSRRFSDRSRRRGSRSGLWRHALLELEDRNMTGEMATWGPQFSTDEWSLTAGEARCSR